MVDIFYMHKPYRSSTSSSTKLSRLDFRAPQRVVLVQIRLSRMSIASLYKILQQMLHPGYLGCRIQTMTLQGVWEEHKDSTSSTHQSTWGGGAGTRSSLAATRAVWILLLTPFESGRSPLAWLDEYRLTYPPSPPSSLAFWLYRKREQRRRGVR